MDPATKVATKTGVQAWAKTTAARKDASGPRVVQMGIGNRSERWSKMGGDQTTRFAEVPFIGDINTYALPMPNIGIPMFSWT
jgi:hypothetical protein